jgi:MHS family shikimate/dehydroshikimate transporter-like MFS transporter
MVPIVLTGSIGTIIEWYDFLIYGTAAALVFNTLFFPSLDPVTGILAALGAYAVSLFRTPAGSVLFGYFGDRLGRKKMLMLTLFVMGFGTFAIGLLPTYEQIGIWAPILLITLRIVQGIGLSGEWGGASLMVLEHAPTPHRGFYGSLVQIGFPLGLVTSSGAFALVTLLSDADFRSWGWRTPFLASIVLLGLGWFVRAKLPETPLFERLKERGEIARNPFCEAVFRDTRDFLIAVGLKISEVSWVYILTVFVVAVGGDRWRPFADYRRITRHRARRNLRRIDHADWIGARNANCNASRARNEGRGVETMTRFHPRITEWCWWKRLARKRVR